MKYKLFTKTKSFRNALRKDIKNAKKSIYLEMYIFIDDTKKSHDFVELLIKKAHKGVEIILIVDGFGSRELSVWAVARMEKAGIEFHSFSDLLRRTHRKIIVIDERITFFGGANIHEGGRKRFDLQIRLRGTKMSKSFLKSFAYTYKMCGGKNQHILRYYKKSFFKKIKTFIIENLPGHRLYRINEYYREKIINAKKSIRLTTPYFIPPRRLMAILDDAIRRKVRVEIIIPRNTEIKTLTKLNQYYINRFWKIGIDFYAIPQMNHAKMMIIDDKEAVVGSQNIDKLSFSQNAEIGAFFRQKNLVKGLLNIFNTRKKQSKPYKNTVMKLNIRDNIVQLFLRLVFYFM